MVGRDPRRDEDDDWFVGLDDASETRREREPAAFDDAHATSAESGVDDWLSEEDTRTRPQEGLLGAWLGLIDRRVAIVVASLVVLLVAALAAAGVFSGSGARPATLSTPTATQPATTTTSTPRAAVPYPSTTLKPGDRGAQVTTLQRALASLGYSPGKADGVYGTGTQAALTQFQRAGNLKADGVFGPATRAALIKALRGP